MRNGKSALPVQLKLNSCAVSLTSDKYDTHIFFPRPCTFNALKFPQCLKRRKQQGSISSIYVKHSLKIKPSMWWFWRILIPNLILMTKRYKRAKTMEYILISIEIIKYDCIKQVAKGQNPLKQDFLAMKILDIAHITEWNGSRK